MIRQGVSNQPPNPHPRSKSGFGFGEMEVEVAAAHAKSGSTSSSPQFLFRLFVVRHGETTANAAGIIQGQSSDPSFCLTSLGKLQAHSVGAALDDKKWWKLVSSDLKRAQETVSPWQ